MFVRLSVWNEGDNAERFAALFPAMWEALTSRPGESVWVEPQQVVALFVAGFDVQLTHHHVHQTRRAARRDPQPDYAVLQVAPGFRGFGQR